MDVAAPSAASAVAGSLRILAARAADAVSTLDLDAADELYGAAHVLGTAAGHPELAAESLAGTGYVRHLRGEATSAAEIYARALAASSEGETRALIRTRLGFARYDAGDLAAARHELTSVLDEASSPVVRARVIGYFGNIARASGDTARACALYDEATRALDDAGERRFLATFAMDRAIAALLGGEASQAVSDLEALQRGEAVSADPHLAALVGHYRALARMALGLPADELEPTRLPIGRYLSRVREALRGRRANDLTEVEAEAPENAHARASLEVVTRLTRARLDAPERSLVVSRSGTFFRLGAGSLVMLAQRAPLGRMLVALANARVTKPGTTVPEALLTEAAWPGEKLLPEARKNRLHVAVSTLRKLGLRAVLERRDGGYGIPSDVTTLIVD